MKASDRTPVERTVEMLKQGLEPVTIRTCLGVSERHAQQLVRLARQEIAAEREYRRDYNQRYNLPTQLAAARAKVAVLERKAVRLGLADLVRSGAA